MVDALVRQLAARSRDDDAAKAAAYALGDLGDARGLEALLDAWADAWKPAIVGEAIRLMGAVALAPIIARLEARTELAGRRAALDVFSEVPPDDLVDALRTRLEALQVTHGLGDEFSERATFLLKLASANAAAHPRVATLVLEMLLPEPAKTSSKAGKALRRAAEKARAQQQQ
jgi:hypothetical protein